MFAETIPQLQAQIQQIQVMLNKPSLPPQVRQQTQMKHQQLQMELQQAHIAATMAATFQQQQQQQQQPGPSVNMQYGNMNMQGYQQQQMQQPAYQNWTNPFPNQQPGGQDSAYQRLPLNQRRRNLKRERPSDFLEVGGEGEAKMPRYWE